MWKIYQPVINAEKSEKLVLFLYKESEINVWKFFELLKLFLILAMKGIERKTTPHFDSML